MIVRPAPDGGLLLFAQDAHARVTEPLARAWRFPLPRADEVARACGMHDNGWIEWDAAPRVDASGRPRSYRDMPPDDYRELWRRGFARAWDAGDWVGLLVSLHGSRFFDGEEDAADRAVIAAERARQRDALARLGHADASSPDALPPDVAAGFGLVRYLDGLSLFLCDEWDSPWTADAPGDLGPARVTMTRDGDSVRLAPWPFDADALDVRVTARRVREERFASDADLRRALADADGVELEWRLEPA